MFNIGSFEVLLICVIALLVLGPERLPTAVRTTGLWVGRFRRSFYKVKAEIERELNADEIKRQLHNESVMAEIEEARSDIESVAKDTEESVNKIVNSADFDPGASKYTEQQRDAADAESAAVNQKSFGEELKEDIAEAGEQLEEVKQSLYGSGKNPKLADRNLGTKSEEPSARDKEPSARNKEPSAPDKEPSAQTKAEESSTTDKEPSSPKKPPSAEQEES